MSQPMTADKKTRMRLNRKLAPAGMRCCNRCLVIKSVGQFGKHGDGYRSACRDCRSAKNAKWREANPEYFAKWHAEHREERREYFAARRAENSTRPLDIGDAHLAKRCRPETSGGCGQLKTRGDFHRKRSEWDRRQPLCRDCTARRNANSGYQKACRQAHGSPIGTPCYLCGETMNKDDALHVDHVFAQSLADDCSFPLDVHAGYNLRFVHNTCNLARGNKPTTYEQFKRLVPEIFPLRLQRNK